MKEPKLKASDRQWFVYALVDPRTDEVRYIGWAHDARRRLRKHIADSKRETTHKANWIRSLLADGLGPRMHGLEDGWGDSWIEAEQRWIAHYRALGADLTNHTEGGDGTPGYRITEELRRRISESRKGIPISPEKRALLIAAHTGKPLSEDHRRKISEALKGRKASDESRRKQSLTRKGRHRRPFTPEHRANLSEAATGRKMGPWTEEHRRKVYEAKGISHPESE